MSSQMALTAVWISDDLEAFCLLHLALVTRVTWDRNSSAEVAPLHNSLMYSDNRNSPASGEEKMGSLINLHSTYYNWVIFLKDTPAGCHYLAFLTEEINMLVRIKKPRQHQLILFLPCESVCECVCMCCSKMLSERHCCSGNNHRSSFV